MRFPARLINFRTSLALSHNLDRRPTTRTNGDDDDDDDDDDATTTNLRQRRTAGTISANSHSLDLLDSPSGSPSIAL